MKLRKGIPDRPTSRQEEKIEEAKRQEEEDSNNLLSSVSAAFRKDNIIVRAAMSFTEPERGPVNKHYKLTPTVIESAKAEGLNSRQVEQLEDSGSDENAMHELEVIKSDIELNKELERLDYSLGFRFIAGAADPTNLLPLGFAARTSKFYNIVRSAIGTSVATGVSEGVLMSGDSTRDLYDVGFAMAAGATFGAGLGALRRTASGMPTIIDEAVDREVQIAAKQVIETPKAPLDSVDTLGARQQLASLEADLQNKIGIVEGLESVLNRTDVDEGILSDVGERLIIQKKQITEIQDHISQVEQTNADLTKIPIIEEVTAPRDKTLDYTLKGDIADDTPDGGAPKKPIQNLGLDKKSRNEILGHVEAGGDSLPTDWKITPRDQATMQRVMAYVEDMPVKLGIDSWKWAPKIIKDKLQAGFTKIDQSGLPLQRGLNLILAPNPQGNSLKVKTSASISAYRNLKQIEEAGGAIGYKLGFEKWSKNLGKGKFRAWGDFSNTKKDFDREVFLAIHDPRRKMGAEVRSASEGLGTSFQVAGDLQSKSGAAGFTNLTNTRYVPIMYDSTGMLRAVQDHGEEAVVEVVSKAYQQGDFKMNKETSDKVAKIQVFRARQSALSLQDGIAKVLPTKTEISDIAEKLKKAGVDPEDIDEFLSNEAVSAMNDGILARGKKSLRPDPSVVGGTGLKFTDLIHTNIAEISTRYNREAAGNAAMASRGFPTMTEALRTVTVFEQAAIFGVKKGPASDNELAKINSVSKELRGMVNMIYGKTVESNPHSTRSRAARVATDLTATTRLQMLGLAQVAETAKLLNQMGVVGVIKALPGLNLMIRASKKEGGTLAGLPKQPEMKELFEHVGWFGEDHLMNIPSIRNAEAGDIISDGAWANNFKRIANNSLTGVGKITEVWSGFRHIQGGIEKIAMRGIKNTIINMAEGKTNFLNKAFVQRDMIEVGWDKTFQNELFAWVKANPKNADWGGSEVRLMNFPEMPPEMYSQLTDGMVQMSARLIQRNFIGESSVWMNTTLGRVLSQFRTFQLVGLEKQLIHDLKSEHIRNAQLMAWSSVLGTMSYSAGVYLNSLSKDDPEKYRDQRLTPELIALGAMNKASSLAPLTLGFTAIEALTGAGGAIEERTGIGVDSIGRLGGSSLEENIPAIGLGNDFISAGKSAVSLAINPSNKKAKRFKQDMRSIIPLINTPVVKMGIELMNQGSKVVK